MSNRVAGGVLPERGWLGLGRPAVGPCSLLGSVWVMEAAAAVVAAGLAALTVAVMDSQ
jgi:hypothetical protein